MTIAPSDLTVVIPTRERPAILSRTLAALAGQSVLGFDIIVVLDGVDQEPVRAPDLGAGIRFVRQDRAGPGVARNLGVRNTNRPLILFLGDDMVPDPKLVERHLLRHAQLPSENWAVLGHVEWHREVRRTPLLRWIDRSHSQFDFPAGGEREAGWGRFYSCNVSMKRRLFEVSGGFDPEFDFDYEDLDLGYRLSTLGMRLDYERAAVARHLHPYDWDKLTGRYHSRGQGEWRMAAKHSWFRPFFGYRIEQAAAVPPASRLWPLLTGLTPEWLVRARLHRLTDIWYHQNLAPYFRDGWAAAQDLAELRDYLGAAYELANLRSHQELVAAEELSAPDERSFYRTSRAYLYDLTAFAMMGVKIPYRMALTRTVPSGARLLDFGCGVGSDGLRLLGEGYQVAFADFDNPSLAYLRWRLEQRGIDAPVYDVEAEIPGGFHAAYAFDVIEHVPDPFAFLARLEASAQIVAVNLLSPIAGETHLHHSLPTAELRRYAHKRGLLHDRLYHGRSRLLIYHSGR